MSLKRLFFIIIFISVFIMGFVFYINKAFLYSPETTHYNLTKEMVKLYNLIYESDITPGQLELLLRGTIDEDILPRPAFHMYDPVYNRAPFGVATAKEWALNFDIQQLEAQKFSTLGETIRTSGNYAGNFSWPAVIKSYIKNDEQYAYYALGHILHLIEDMTVPAHSRNDPHPPGNTDPYETWTNKNNEMINFNLAEPLYNKGYRPVEFYSIGEYFDNLARYSNKYFFSKDNTKDKTLYLDYGWPEIVQEKQEDYGIISQRTYAWGRDQDGNLFRLAGVETILVENKKKYYIDEKDTKLNTDYWTRLAPKAVLYGAGVIRLFIEEAEWEKKLAEKQNPEPSFFQKAQIFIQDLFGIGGEEKVQESVTTPVTPSESLPQPKPSRFPNGGPAIQPVVQGASIDKTDQADKTDKSDKSETTEKTGEVKGAAEEKDGQKGTGSIVVTGPKTGGGGGASRPDTQEPTQSPTPTEPPITEPEDTTPPDVLIESLLYNYASSSLNLKWSSSEIPSVSFDVEYKQGNGDWQNLLASASETQVSLSINVQDIIYYFRVKARDDEDNESNWQEKSIEILSKPVVINEIAWMGTKADVNDEWIELYNRAEYDVDLDGWILKSDDSSPEIVFISGDSENKTTVNNIILAKGYYLVERISENDEPDDATSIPADWYGSFSHGLKNSGEVLELKDNSNNLIDSVDTWYAGNNESKRTMERVNPAVAGTDSKNWQTYIGSGSMATDVDGNPIFGTPKAQNSVYDASSPSKIDDLAISDSSGTFLILQWTAPSDEKSSLSLTYDIRYASESISEENWASLSQIADIPLVENPGTIQLASISGLKYNTTYYFAIKTSDGLNISELSNVLVYSTGSPPSLAKSAWPLFQRDVGHTGLSPYIGPDFTASSSISPKWVSDLGAPIYASPVIGLDDTIYVGDIMGKFYAINPNNGSIKWVYDTYNHELGNGGIYFSAAIASDDTIYFSAFGSYLYALTPNGKLKWKYQIGNPNTTGSSPVIGSDGTIYLTGANSTLFAINPDGTLKWQYYIDGVFSVSAPAIGSDGTIYVSSRGSGFDGYLTAIDFEGNLRWTVEQKVILDGQALSIGFDDTIYVGATPGENAPLRAINPANGSIIWSYPIGETWSSAAIESSSKIYAVIRNGALYVVSSDGIGEWLFSAGGLVRGSPIIDSNEVIYFGSEDKKIYAVNFDGSLKWDYELSDGIYSSPVIGSDGTIYIGTADGKFYAIGE